MYLMARNMWKIDLTADVLFYFAYVQVVFCSWVHTALQEHELPCNVPGIQLITYRR